MPLFPQNTLKKYLKQLNDDEVRLAFEVFKDTFSLETQMEIVQMKEEEYQEGFMSDLFVGVLGYTKRPRAGWNLRMELKNESDLGKADAAILRENRTDVAAVVELKSTKTKSLDGIAAQAFGYHRQHPECRYIIISNFQLLRFYIDDNSAYEQFDLFEIANNNDFERFKCLYVYLHQQYLLANLPEKYRAEALLFETQITDTLYKQYDEFRSILYKDICSRNKPINKLLLFEKTQKLIDRLLFAFFAEDKGILPFQTIAKLNKEWELMPEKKRPDLYTFYTQLFNDINTGNPKRQIYAYNGGLFAPDSELENLKIGDNLLLNNSLLLSQYDYKSDIDVNILGHIFEHSLNTMDEMKAKEEGIVVEKKETKRKKDGVFYTPAYITRYIVAQTLGKLCGQKRQQYHIDDDQTATMAGIEQYRQWLLGLKILDPACGSGAFLNQVLEFLLAQHAQLDEQRAALLNKPIVFGHYAPQVLKNNIYGVDLNREAVGIAQLSLWLRTAQPGQVLSDLSQNIKVGNSLINDPKLSAQAFDWPAQFPDVFRQGGFDIIVGNPPYVRAEMLTAIRPYLEKHYHIFQPASDLFGYFYEQSINLLAENGIFGFISNTFEKTTAALKLRQYLQDRVKIDTYVDFTEVTVFAGATTYPIIITAQKQKPDAGHALQYIKIPQKTNPIVIENQTVQPLAQNSLIADNWVFSTSDAGDLYKKIKQHPSILDTYGKCYRGIITGLNEAFIVPQGQIAANMPEHTHLKPVYEGYEIKKWTAAKAVQDMIVFESKWSRKKYGNREESQIWQLLQEDCPNLTGHLTPYEEKARQRYDKGDFWWELRHCAYYNLFEQPKIIFPNLQNSNKFAFDPNGIYLNAPAVFLPTNDKALLAILNAKLVWYFLKSICVVRSGGYIEVKPQYFEQIPIPKRTIAQQLQLEHCTAQMIDLTNNLQTLKSLFLAHLGEIFGTDLDMAQKKIANFEQLAWAELIAELNKQKCRFSLPQEAETQKFFEHTLRQTNALQGQIKETDHQLNQLVYALYDLNDSEIALVEESLNTTI